MLGISQLFFVSKTVVDWVGRSTFLDDAALLETRSGKVIQFIHDQSGVWFYAAVALLLSFGVFLILPAGRLSFPWALKKVAGKTFINCEVLLDGHCYEGCTFNNVTFVFNGGRFALERNTIMGHFVKSDLRELNGMTKLLFELGHLKHDALQSENGLVTRSNIES